MHRRARAVGLVCVLLGQAMLHAQEFKLLDRAIQVHGFASQGFVYTNDNNWLTMNTSQGSGAMTEFGLNMSSQLTDRLRIGAQVYDRNLGQLGQYHPSLDWAVADYRFKNWLGVRGGKVKTRLGLYNDTQDQDFLRVFALLPQSVYPTDLRDATIAHVGGDVYGDVSLSHGMGDLFYTAYVGHRSDSIYSGIAYLLTEYGILGSSYRGLQYGGDLRWNTPVKGLLIGASRLNEDLTDKATIQNPFNPAAGRIPFVAVSKADWLNQFYGEYVVGKLRIDTEYRRNLHDEIINGSLLHSIIDVRGWYVSGAYRVRKRLEVGSYYSRYSITSVAGGPLAPLFGVNQTDTGLPANHIYDKVITGRVDLNKFWNVKVEGHFMDGYGTTTYPDGFYPEVNPQGFKPNTRALVLKTGINF